VYAPVALGPSRDQVQTYDEANQQYMQSCMGSQGLEFPGRPTLFSHESYEARLEYLYFDDIDRIRREGYLWPEITGIEGDDVEVSPETDKAAEGCAEPFRKLLDGALADWGGEFPLETIEASIRAQATSTPSVEAAKDAWKACMESRGFDSSLYEEAPTTSNRTVDMALADSACRGESGRSIAILTARAEALSEWIESHPTEVQDLKELWVELVDGALAIVESQ
jgi:hypothetical protein